MKKVFQVIFVFVLALAKGQVSSSGCYLSGALINPGSTAGCGNSGTNYCNIASLFVPAFSPVACGNFTSAALASGGNYFFTTSYILPAGCTASVQAEFKKRSSLGIATGSGCDNSGMDSSPDKLYITSSGGAIASQGSTINVNVGTCGAYTSMGIYSASTASINPGCANADGTVALVTTGGTLTVGGASDRADEFITFTVNLSGTCGSNCSSVLPIELTDFTGAVRDGMVDLYWKVATEESTIFYTVEKSMDARTWVPLGMIYTNPAYNRNLTYHFTDDFPAKGTNYYRLRDTDRDGTTEVHEIIAVNYQLNADNFQVMQTEEEIIINCNPSFFQPEIILTGLDGKDVKKVKAIEANIIKISKKDVQKGLYVLHFTNYPFSGKTKLLVY